MFATRSLLKLSLVLALPLAACTDSTGNGGEPSLKLDGILEANIANLPGAPFGVRVAPNDAIWVTHQLNNQVTVIYKSGPRDSTLVGNDPADVVITSSGNLAIVSSFVDGDLHFLNTSTGVQSDETDIGSNAYRLALSSDGRKVFVTTTGGKVYAVNVANGNKADSVQLTGSIQGIARRDANVIAVSSTDGTVTLLSAATLDVIESIDIGAENQDIAFSADRKRLFVAQEVGRIMVLDGSTLAREDSLTFATAPNGGPFAPFGMAMSPDKATLVVASASPARIAVVDSRTMEILNYFTVSNTPRRVAFKRDGTRAYIANEGGYLNVIR